MATTLHALPSADHKIIAHDGRERSYTFRNDTGSAIVAGQWATLGVGEADQLVFFKRAVGTGETGEAHAFIPRDTICQFHYDAAADVAPGERLDFNRTTGEMTKAAAGEFVAAPRDVYGDVNSATGAASTGDPSILAYLF